MLDRVSEGTQQRVTGVVTRLLSEGGKPTAVGADDRLVDAGLTSMDMVNLMLGVEAEFDVMIPPDQITPANFSSITSIASLVERVVAGEG